MFGYIRNSFYLCKVNETGGRERSESILQPTYYRNIKQNV